MAFGLFRTEHDIEIQFVHSQVVRRVRMLARQRTTPLWLFKQAGN